MSGSAAPDSSCNRRISIRSSPFQRAAVARLNKRKQASSHIRSRRFRNKSVLSTVSGNNQAHPVWSLTTEAGRPTRDPSSRYKVRWAQHTCGFLGYSRRLCESGVAVMKEQSRSLAQSSLPVQSTLFRTLSGITRVQLNIINITHCFMIRIFTSWQQLLYSPIATCIHCHHEQARICPSPRHIHGRLHDRTEAP